MMPNVRCPVCGQGPLVHVQQHHEGAAAGPPACVEFVRCQTCRARYEYHPAVPDPPPPEKVLDYSKFHNGPPNKGG